MAQNYTRQSSFADGDTITASLFNNEYNQLVNAFAYSSTDVSATGHRHDGSIGQGGNIAQIGDLDFNNKIVVDGTNNRWGFFVEVAGASVEQIRLQDGSIIPVTTNDIDLGSASLQFKDAYFDGTVNADSLVLSSGATVTAVLDEDAMTSNSATALATQQSIKAYVDSQVTAQDLDFQGDSGGALSIDLDSETLTIAGGTGIDTSGAINTLTVSIDSTVATLTGTQTLTNKTLTSPDINGGTIDGAVIGATTAAAGSFTTVAASGNITVGGTVDGRDVAADGTKLDGIEALADVTDTTNVTAAGALMDSELTNITAVKALNQGVSTTDSPSFAGLTASGEIAANGGIALGDNDKATFGASDDLQIYHDGSNSYIDEVGTGNLLINADSLRLRDTSGNPYLLGNVGAEVRLYYNGSTKVQTTSTGIDVTGEITADGIALGDNQKATFGASDDLQIYHNGVHSYIQDNGTGNLRVPTSNFQVRNAADNAAMFTAIDGGSTYLYNNGNLKLEATSTGIDVTGTVTADGLTVDGGGGSGILITNTLPELVFEDTSAVGAGSDKFIIRSVTAQANGDYELVMNNDQTSSSDIAVARFYGNGDVSLFEDTGTTAKFYWDASAEGLGIGNTSFSNKLNVTGAMSSAGTPLVQLSENSGNARDGLYLDYTGTTNAAVYSLKIADATKTHLAVRGDGNVGIGTSSPSGILHLSAGNPSAYFTSADTGSIYLYFGGTTSPTKGLIRYSDNADFFSFNTDSAEAMRIDSSGNVGIGTSSPSGSGWDQSSTVLHVYQNTTNGGLLALESSNTKAILNAGNNQLAIFTTTSDPIRIGTSGSERARIDSSGNLLVGKTSADFGTSNGLQVASNGYTYITRTSATANVNTVLTLDRKTSDGEILRLNKDGATVGSIGASGGDLIVGTGDTGLYFYDGADTVIPWNISSNSARSGSIDLGASSHRFKDLYLSGGVYLGGTGAANHLDDYEEGTFTPVLADNNSGGNEATPYSFTGLYTKVGNTVTVIIELNNIDTTGLTLTNDAYITGLPFTCKSGNAYGSVRCNSMTFTGSPTAQVNSSSTYLRIAEQISGGTVDFVRVIELTSGAADIHITATYLVV